MIRAAVRIAACMPLAATTVFLALCLDAAGGLTGAYYDTAAFGTLKTTRVDATVNFDWGTGTPSGTALTNGDTFSVIWTGQIEPEFTELYTFYVTADDDARLWIDDRLVTLRTFSSARDFRGQIALRAGACVNIRLEYVEQTGSAKVRLEWSSASRAREVIPSASLFPARVEKAGGALLEEHWTGIAGGAIASLTFHANFPQKPGGREFVSAFECLAPGWTNNYGTRVTGYLVPPVSGSYTFAVSADDTAELYLSTDATTNNKALIASVSSATGFRDWTVQPSQISAPRALAQGQRYYVELLHKEDAGADHWSVGWRKPGDAAFSVVPGSALVQAGITNAQPAESALLNTLAQNHPRLFATPERFARLRDTWQSASPSQPKTWAQSAINGANTILSQAPVTYSPDVRDTILSQAQIAKDRLYKLGLAWQLTGQTNYAERAWAELEAVAAFPDWHPAHFLDTAELTHACAIGYDWLYHYWTADRRAVIRGAIITNGLNAGLSQYTSNAGWSKSTGNNWNMVCNGGLTIGALALGTESESLVENILNRAINSTRPVWAHFTTDNGAWYEGPGYWNYTTEYGIRMLAALENALGSDFAIGATLNLSETGLAPIFSVGSTGKLFNFADASAGGAQRGPVFQWLARRHGQPLYTGWQNMGNGGALDALWWDGQSATLADLAMPPDMAFHGPAGTAFQPQEMVTLRGNWTDARTTFIGCKSGEMGAPHGNLDAGTFVLDALGKRWFHDLGADNYALPGYFSDTPSSGTDRWDYYRMRPEGQNTLTINPSSGPDMTLYAVARLIAYQSEPSGSGSFAIHDLTPVYTGMTRVWRGCRLLGARNQMLLQDEILASSGKTVWWFAHIAYPATEVAISPDGTAAMLTQGADRLWCKILSGGGTFQLRDATPLPTSPDPDGQNTNDDFKKLAILLTGVTNTTLAVWFVPLASGEQPPSATPDLSPLNTWSLNAANDAPLATGGNAYGDLSSSIDIDLRAYVADDATPPDHMRFEVFDAAGGAVTLLPDGLTARFTPAPGYSGTPSFRFAATDAGPDSRALLVYDFEPPDASSPSDVPDASGQGRDGVLDAVGTGAATRTNDVPSAFGRNGRSLDLAENGGANAARLSRAISAAELNFNTSDWTITGWFKRRDSQNEDMVWHLNFGDGFGSGEELYLMAHSASNLSLHHYPGPDVNIVASNVTPNVWHHCAVIRSGTTLSLYLNGAPVGTDACFALNINPSYPLIFGGHTDTSATYAPRWFDGALDDLAVYTAALSPSEIAALAAGISARHLGGLTSTGTVTLGATPCAFVWTNALTGTALPWSAAANWSARQTPPSSPGTALHFFTGISLGGAVTSHNDLAQGFALNSLTLSGTAASSASVTLTGGALTLSANALTRPSITLDATAGAGLAYDVATPLTLADATTIGGAGTASLRLSGAISGPGTLIKEGNRTLTLAGDSTYAGETIIRAGTLQIGADGPAGSLGAGSIANDGQLRFDRTGTLAVPNDISGAGTLYIDCPKNEGTIVLSGSNTFTGAVTVNSGALRITRAEALGLGAKTVNLSNGTAGAPQLRLDGSAAPIELPSNITYRTSYAAGAIINEAGTNTLHGDITLTAGGGDTRILVTSGALTLTGALAPNTTNRKLQLAGAGTGLVAGPIADGEGSNTLAVSKYDAGVWTLSGSNSFTRGLTIEAGRLIAAHPSALGNGACSLSSGATLDLNGQSVILPDTLTLRGNGVGSAGALINSSASSAAIGGTSTVALAANTFIGGNGDLLLDRPVSGAYALTKIGSATLTLAASNTYSGTTAVSNGTLVLRGSLAGGLTVAPGATFVPDGAPVVAGGLTLAAGSTVAFRLNGPEPGTQYDRLTASAAVTLGATLSLQAAPGLAPGAVFTLLDKTSSGTVSGTFAALPNAAAFFASGYIWRIRYDGGTGNDVTLALLVPSTVTNVWTQTAPGIRLWSDTANWRDAAEPLASPDASVVFLPGQTLGPGTLSARNDLAGPFALARLTLSGTGPASGTATVALSGANLAFGGGTTAPSLALDAAAGPDGLSYIVSNTLSLAETLDVRGNGSAAFLLAGSLQGPGGLAKSGAATLALSGTNTFTGGLTLAPATGAVRAEADTARNALGFGLVAIGANSALDLLNRNTSAPTLTLDNAFTGAGTLRLTLAAGGAPRTTRLSGLDGFAGAFRLSAEGPSSDQWDAAGLSAPLASVAADSGTRLSFASGHARFSRIALQSVTAAQTNTVHLAPGASLTLDGPGGLTVGLDAGSNTVSRCRMTGGGALVVTNPAARVTVGLAQANQNWNNSAVLDLSGLGEVTFGSDAAPLLDVRVGYGLTATGLLTLSDTRNTIIATALHVGHSAGGNGGSSTLVLGAGENLVAADTLNIGISKSSGTVAFASQIPGAPGTLTLRGRTRPAADLTLGDKTGTGTAATPVGTLDLRGHAADLSVRTLTLGRENNNNTQYNGGATGRLYFDAGAFTVSNIIMAAKSAAGIGPATAALTISGGAFTVLPGGAFTLASQSGGGSASGTLTISGGTLTCHADILEGGGNATSSVTLDGGTLDMNGRAIGAAAPRVDILQWRSGTLRNLGQLNGGEPFAKTGPGTLTLDGANVYSGATIVSNGTLRLAGTAVLPPANDVSLATGATLDLAYAGTQTVHTLTIGGVQKVAGVYGATRLPASLAGPGFLRVTAPPSPRTLLLIL